MSGLYVAIDADCKLFCVFVFKLESSYLDN